MLLKDFWRNKAFLYVVIVPNILTLIYFSVVARSLFTSDSILFVEKPTAAYGMSSDSIMLAREKNAGNYLFRNFARSYGEFSRLNRRYDFAKYYAFPVDFIQGYGGITTTFRRNDNMLFHYYRQQIVDIDLDKKSGLLNMSVHAPTARMARQLAGDIIADAREQIRNLNHEEEETFDNTAGLGVDDIINRQHKAETQIEDTLKETGIYSGWLYYEGLMNEQTNLNTRRSPIEGKSRSLMATSPFESQNQSDTVLAYKAELANRFTYLSQKRAAVTRNDTLLTDIKALSDQLAKLEVRKNAYALQNIMGRYYIKTVDAPSFPLETDSPASLMWIGIIFLASCLIFFMFC